MLSSRRMTARATSFSKSVFFGLLPEELVFPYPHASPSERESLSLILEQLQRFVAEQVHSARIDEEASIPEPVLRGLKELGLFGVAIPEAYGGIGLSATGYARVMQEMGALDSSLAVTLGAHQSIGCKGILLFGTEAQKQRYLPRCASGQTLAAFCLTEPSSGSDAASIQTRAVRQPDGSFRLSGNKIWITNGGLADLFTVFAQTEVEKDGQKRDRITAFIVERGFGVKSGREEHKLGIKGSSTTALYFEDVPVPAENVLGEVGGGFKVAMEILNNGRLGLAAGCVGLSRTLIQLAIAHATSRRQFSRPIAEFGLIKDKIGRMIVDTWAAESMVYLTTGMIDRGAEDYSIESACCKIFGSETLWRVVNEALQISAGAGYMKEYPYERLLRDARINLIFEGTNEILRLFVALSGMQGPGERLAQLASVIREPVKKYGLLVDYVVHKVKASAFGERLESAHPLLKKEAVLVEDAVQGLANSVEKVLRRHGRRIVEMQFAQRRVAEAAIDLYAMMAALARATGTIEVVGQARAETETRLCRTFCGQAAARIRRGLAEFDDNDDELLKSIADDAYAAGRYTFDAVLGD
jgi:acyl-CoA dehydrogenase family protein 9